MSAWIRNDAADFEPLEDVLDAGEELRQRLGRDADVFDERERSRPAREAVQPGDGRGPHTAHLRHALRVARSVRPASARVPRRSASTTPQARSVASRSVSASNVDEQRRPDRRWDRADAVRLPARNGEQPAVEQVARDRFVDAQIEPGPHRRVERGESESARHVPPASGIVRSVASVTTAERAFRADEQLRQIDTGAAVSTPWSW